jgi:superfamily II DNA or RNA helicase
MTQVEVTKVNESFVKVYSDFNIESEIKDYFTFKSPGYQFSPKYRARLWDGNISLYNVKTKFLPIGLYPRLQDFCRDNNIEIIFKECDRFSAVSINNDLDVLDVSEFVMDLNIWSKNGPITARDYQVEAIHQAIHKRRVTLISPTSSGKSLIIYCIIRWLLEDDPDARILLLVPNVTLVNQMIGDFKDYSQQNGWDVDKHCQRLYSGQTKELSKRVLVTTWQSFTKIASDRVQGPKILSLYKAVIADEAHGAKGKEMQSILEKCAYASYRIGTTGTIDTSTNAKINTLQIEGSLGPLYKVITTKELIDTNQVSGLKIKTLVLKYSTEEAELLKKAEYQEEIKWLVENNKRNAFLMKVALATDGTTLLLVKNRESHAKKLFDALTKVSSRPVYYVAGTVDPDERERIRQVANKEDCIIVATFASFSTGVNLPNIRHVIFGCPSKSSITVLQSIGRGLRLHTNKTHMVLWDVIDDLRYKKSTNYSYDHGVERLSIYRREKFDIGIKEIPFN